MRVLLCLSLLLAVSTLGVSARKNWALLIAGSASYMNYRHQADICHAYQIMHKAGIPDEQIVVMMYDDIANNTQNPFPGNIINKPNGPNVYPGTLKDYTGSDVNAKTFLAVLQGDKAEVKRLTGREGKVIDSGPDDYVFVNFADHGGPGILGMPEPPYLKATDVNKALKSMYAKKRFAKLNFYVEACESGSIFSGLLPGDINVYATTAANTHESSWGCYWDDSRSAYLGDTYSVKWMEDTDVANLNTETFEQQYKTVKKETTRSHVQQYGDTSIASFVLAKFFGNNKQLISNSTKPTRAVDQVPSEMVSLQTLKNRIQAAPANSQLKSRLEGELVKLQTTMTQTHDLIWDIVRTVYSEVPEKTAYDRVMKTHEDIKSFDCYYSVVDTLLGFCPGLDVTKNDFALRKFYALVNLCNHNEVGRIISAAETAAVINPLCRF
ncbi:legumain [Aplysia californica]|uniref:Legumain n=1 Tax=Aplysia californica TaxID=6500 RepID=A0ABM0JMW7_APLCA|nr:legumain [Aplysia californica]